MIATGRAIVENSGIGSGVTGAVFSYAKLLSSHSPIRRSKSPSLSRSAKAGDAKEIPTAGASHAVFRVHCGFSAAYGPYCYDRKQ